MLLRRRHEFALFCTALLFAGLIELPQIQVVRTHELPPPVMEVTLSAAAPPPAPPAPLAPPTPTPPPVVPPPVVPPAPLPPPPPLPAVAESATHPLTPPPDVKKPIEKQKHVKVQTPRPATPPPAPSHVAAPAAPAAAAPSAAPPAPMAAPPAAGALNSSYIGLVTAEVKAQQHYPTGREAMTQHPQGTATVWFTLSRSGQLIDAGIDNASGSIILDHAALLTVQRAAYPPFPEDAFPGESQHRFTVNLQYVAPSS